MHQQQNLNNYAILHKMPVEVPDDWCDVLKLGNLTNNSSHLKSSTTSQLMFSLS